MDSDAPPPPAWAHGPSSFDRARQALGGALALRQRALEGGLASDGGLEVLHVVDRCPGQEDGARKRGKTWDMNL